MAQWTQHLLVLLLVAGCVGVVGLQIVNTFRGRRSRVGSCCSTGCAAEEQRVEAPKVVFFPSASLARKR